MQVNVFTAMVRDEFVRAYNDIDPAKPAPWEPYTSTLDSTTKEENYAWMSPTPGIAEYTGHRRPYELEPGGMELEMEKRLR